ncbi:MAG TPA: hypothetical protein VLC98_18025 [Phnomibacter sp.]|nr:hypothetical protein [Phnomibacter sp.]
MYNTYPPHKFHIPVMGLAYTIDSPVKVARFGIASVISIVEDGLLEMMRSYYCATTKEKYNPISKKEDDYRARRVTDYLNLVNKIVNEQVDKLKASAFEKGSEIIKYFEMLPDDSKLKELYVYMKSIDDLSKKEEIETFLRTQIQPGNIDVNIMTKVDGNRFDKEGALLQDGSEAVSALRGYAKSDLVNSSVIFSAGMNPRLFNYMETQDVFDADENGVFKKKVIIKVSDYRSALIQGKYLAKKGIWVSEFRIESGLNCGGHAFATEGFLMGPILEEFKTKKEELVEALFQLYNQAIKAKGKPGFDKPHAVKITAQGGIGTFEEHDFLHKHYGVESTGWGTPFLVVPEATTVDEHTLDQLCKAGKEDVMLSKNSPLGVRFHYLKNSSAEIEKLERIAAGKPGSPCTEEHLALNTEFTEEPICTASRKYQKLKLAHLETLQLPEEEYQQQVADTVAKECLCVGLSNSAAKVIDRKFVKHSDAVNICPGPNIAYFSKVVSLQTMTDHIYGRTDVVENNERPHMFVAELGLYVNHYKEQLQGNQHETDAKQMKYCREYYKNLLEGIAYYRALPGLAQSNRPQFLQSLDIAEAELNALSCQFGIA